MGNVIRNMETLKKRIKIINRSQKCCYRNEECPLWSYQRLDMDEERISALRDRSIETSHFEKQREKKKKKKKNKNKTTTPEHSRTENNFKKCNIRTIAIPLGEVREMMSSLCLRKDIKICSEGMEETTLP